MPIIKLEIKGNFLKITNENINDIKIFSRALVSYLFKNNNTILELKTSQLTNQIIYKYKIDDLVDKQEQPFTDLDELETFLSDNLGISSDFNSGGGNGSGVVIKQKKEVYSSLSPGEEIGDLAYVENSEGTAWLPSTVGGTYYPAGFYLWDGNFWVSDRNAIANQLEKNMYRDKYVSIQADLTRENQTTIPLANQQQNIYEEYLRLDYPCTVTDNYFISIAFKWSTNIGNTNALFRLALTDGSTTQFQEVAIEAKDPAGTGEVVNVIESGTIVGDVNTGTDIRVQEYFPVDVILEEGKNYSVSLEFTHQGNAARTTIYSSTIRIEQKTQNP